MSLSPLIASLIVIISPGTGSVLAVAVRRNEESPGIKKAGRAPADFREYVCFPGVPGQSEAPPGRKGYFFFDFLAFFAFFAFFAFLAIVSSQG